MAKGKDSPDADVSQHLEHKASSSTDITSTLSDSAKPKSSTSEAANTKPKRRTIKRCSESDEEGIEDDISEPVKPKTTTSESIKPKTSTTKKQVTEKPIDSDHEDEEDDEDEEDEESSDDEQTNTKKSTKANPLALKKQALSKKQTRKRPSDSDDDDDVVKVASKSKKPKTQPAISSSSKKQKRTDDNNSDDNIVELPSKTTKTKPKANQKQSVKSSNSTLTKKQPFKASKEPEVVTDSDEGDSSDDEEAPNVTVTERQGNLFTAPANTLLLHACNCVGSWGAGIAAAFKKHYPDHFVIYKAHCESKTPNALLSTCLLIPPQPSGPQHWIGCLFTSKKYGRGKDSKDDIMDSTDSAMQDMLEQLADMEDRPKQIWMCKINSGSFKVPWSQTKKLIESLTFKDALHIQIVDKK